MTKQEHLIQALHSCFSISSLAETTDVEAFSTHVSYGEVTLNCPLHAIKETLRTLQSDAAFAFESLIDLCAVDYLQYGQYDWETESSTETGFSRGVERQAERAVVLDTPRFAVVYHLLSITHNHRLRVKVFLDEKTLIVPSVHDIWKGANWFEREAYDLYGVLFADHPDLRRILTDYGFIGYPFRKDFPLIGEVAMRYDATLAKVIYEPVDIQPRITVPKVIREDNRYAGKKGVPHA